MPAALAGDVWLRAATDGLSLATSPLEPEMMRTDGESGECGVIGDAGPANSLGSSAVGGSSPASMASPMVEAGPADLRRGVRTLATDELRLVGARLRTAGFLRVLDGDRDEAEPAFDRRRTTRRPGDRSPQWATAAWMAPTRAARSLDPRRGVADRWRLGIFPRMVDMPSMEFAVSSL